MNSALYIGIYTDGSTSKMRADILRSILDGWTFRVIDTDVPKHRMSRLWQSIGFRYKQGPLINEINEYILRNICEEHYELIWIDKAIYLTPATTQILKSKTSCLVHYTPDTALIYNYSKLFNESLHFYDYVITTKSFEINLYAEILRTKKHIIYVTQGYDNRIHTPTVDFKDKHGIAFVGRYEKERSNLLHLMLTKNIPINLAGPRWDKFVKSHKQYDLHYFGKNIVNIKYAHLLSSSLMGLGFLSKLFPEMHTTRTFEIPSCGTALLTERNEETTSFFNENEAIFYSSTDELIEKVKYYMVHLDELREITENGYKRVISDGRDYESILRNILKRIL